MTPTTDAPVCSYPGSKRGVRVRQYHEYSRIDGRSFQGGGRRRFRTRGRSPRSVRSRSLDCIYFWAKRICISEIQALFRGKGGHNILKKPLKTTLVLPRFVYVNPHEFFTNALLITGCCCIDEFDKMGGQHHALLEAMV